MTSVYVDTSSLVKFYYPEEGSDRVEELLLGSDRIYLSHLTVVEMASAFTQKVRTGDVAKRAESIMWDAFQDDLAAGKVEMVHMLDRHYFKAVDIIRKYGHSHGIKTLDALHLAVAHGLPHATFVSSDKTLVRVARALGMGTLQR